jgi:serine protease Do
MEENKTQKEEGYEQELSLHRQRFLLFLVGFIFVFGVGFLGGYLGSLYGDGSTGIANIGQRTVQIKEESEVIDVVGRVKPSVVSVVGEGAQLNFFGASQRRSAGTGFIVSDDGLIITNKHVVSGRGSYKVVTNDGKEYPATVRAVDPNFDIAFIKVEANNLRPIEFGDSDAIRAGQRVLAIGNALGQLDNTVTYGVVSAVGRSIVAGDGMGESELLENLIQTDAAINPGNSGGPLVNIGGQVIGINTATSAQGEGIGFAIPINVARTALDSVIKTGKITRPMIGVRYVNLTKELIERNNLEVGSGALLYAEDGRSVLAGSPAARAGLKNGDIITKINGESIEEGKSLISIISKYKVGEKISLTYVRDRSEKTIELILAENKS